MTDTSSPDGVVVVLTDADHTSSILLTASDAAALTGAATESLFTAFFGDRGGGEPSGQGDDRWLREFVGAGVVQAVTEAPERGDVETSTVHAGDVIAPNPLPGRGDISVARDGRVLRRNVDEADVYWYESAAPLSTEFGVTTPDGAGSVHTHGEILGTSLLPRRIDGGQGFSCVPCAGCAICGGCAGCAVCGPSPAAVAGLVGIDTTLGVIAVAGASHVAEILRGT